MKRYESPLFTALLYVILIAGFLATALDPTGLTAKDVDALGTAPLPFTNMVMLIVGLLMLIAGMAIRLVAIATLKSNFSGLLRIREGHTLVTNGIYHWVRHPAYLGAILLFLAFPVMLSSILGLLVMSLLIPYLLHRMTLEEKMLVERFGAEYEEYMRQSKRLIPLVY